MSLRDEIGEQPAVASRLLTDGRGQVESVAAALSQRSFAGVMIAARGTSDHAAIYAQYLLGAFHRLPVALAAPALTSLYGVPPKLTDWVVIGISQSGRSPDVVGVVAEARRQGAATLAITNAAGSELAEAAELAIEVGAGAERAVAATKSYTAELLAVALLAAAMEPPDGGGPAFGGSRAERLAALEAVPAALTGALETEADAERIAAERSTLERCIVLGRGFDYATAREWALKLKELAQVPADPYSSADFQHGPLALLEPDYPVLAVCSRGATASDLHDLLARLRAEFDVDLIVISDDERTRAVGRAALAIPAGLAEWLTPVVSIVPGQLFAYHLTRARGLDPDRPRSISKVTLTR